jgi:hypothetical protein
MHRIRLHLRNPQSSLHVRAVGFDGADVLTKACERRQSRESQGTESGGKREPEDAAMLS